MSYTVCELVWVDSRLVQRDRDATPEEVAEIQARSTSGPDRETLKSERQVKVNSITVEVGGKVFDGNEVSQNRMTRALVIAGLTGETETEWTLADNTVSTVSLADLRTALALAGKRQSELWPIP